MFEKLEVLRAAFYAKFCYNTARSERSHSWPSALAWKAGISQGIVGSNPTLSARSTYYRSHIIMASEFLTDKIFEVLVFQALPSAYNIVRYISWL